jgi:hypothetical protein
MRRALHAAAAVLAAGTTCAAQGACGDALGPGTLVATSPRYDVAFRADPPIQVARHFALDIVVCPKAGHALPAVLDVDAHMPAHRHGMNYRPSVAPAGGGRFRAEGLLLHMPGAWEFRFDLGVAGGRERVVSAQDIL